MTAPDLFGATERASVFHFASVDDLVDAINKRVALVTVGKHGCDGGVRFAISREYGVVTNLPLEDARALFAQYKLIRDGASVAGFDIWLESPNRRESA